MSTNKEEILKWTLIFAVIFIILFICEDIIRFKHIAIGWLFYFL